MLQRILALPLLFKKVGSKAVKNKIIITLKKICREHSWHGDCLATTLCVLLLFPGA